MGRRILFGLGGLYFPFGKLLGKQRQVFKWKNHPALLLVNTKVFVPYFR